MYLGWAVPTGIILIAAIVVTLVLTNRDAWAAESRSGWSLTGFILITATLAIFFIWTFPTNQATTNWTIMPQNWQDLRRQWEYSHSVNAVLTFLALCAVTAATLVDRRSHQLD